MFRNNVNINFDDIITGEKFVSLARVVHYHYEEKVLPRNFQYERIFYTDNYHIEKLFNILPRNHEIILITHNSDRAIDGSLLEKMPASVKMWFSQNVACNHPKLHSLPIGLENERWFKDICKKQKIINFRNQGNKPCKLLYVNHNVSTNPSMRQKPYELLSDKSWATCKHGRNGQAFDEFLHDIDQHFYVLSPEGNGIDCHRTWEALYMNRVPILTRNCNTKFYEDLPILLIDNYEEITEEFLIQNKQRFLNTDFNLVKLKFMYWKNLIQNNM